MTDWLAWVLPKDLASLPSCYNDAMGSENASVTWRNLTLQMRYYPASFILSNDPFFVIIVNQSAIGGGVGRSRPS
jgi:hypothetical protein